jgi:hypothetical protein
MATPPRLIAPAWWWLLPTCLLDNFNEPKTSAQWRQQKQAGLEFTSKADSAVNNTDAEEAWDNPDVRGPRRHNHVANKRTWYISSCWDAFLHMKAKGNACITASSAAKRTSVEEKKGFCCKTCVSMAEKLFYNRHANATPIPYRSSYRCYQQNENGCIMVAYQGNGGGGGSIAKCSKNAATATACRKRSVNSQSRTEQGLTKPRYVVRVTTLLTGGWFPLHGQTPPPCSTHKRLAIDG